MLLLSIIPRALSTVKNINSLLFAPELVSAKIYVSPSVSLIPLFFHSRVEPDKGIVITCPDAPSVVGNLYAPFTFIELQQTSLTHISLLINKGIFSELAFFISNVLKLNSRKPTFLFSDIVVALISPVNNTKGLSTLPIYFVIICLSFPITNSSSKSTLLKQCKFPLIST